MGVGESHDGTCPQARLALLSASFPSRADCQHAASSQHAKPRGSPATERGDCCTPVLAFPAEIPGEDGYCQELSLALVTSGCATSCYRGH